MFEPGDWVLVNPHGIITIPAVGQVLKDWRNSGDWVAVRFADRTLVVRPVFCRKLTEHELMEVLSA
jgi:hypothetical protein